MGTNRDLYRRNRVAAIVCLYSYSFNGPSNIPQPSAHLKEFCKNTIGMMNFEVGDIDVVYDYLQGVIQEIEKIDEMIKKYAKERPILEVDRLVLAILRLAIYEGFIKRSVDSKVAINEAIEIAKANTHESNVGFLSGVLGAIFKEDPK